MPRAKLLILMRNPIDRAFSHFRMTWNRWNSRKNDGKSALASPERIFLADITREVRILGACDMLQPQQKSCPLLVDTFARCVVPHVRRATVSAGSYGFLTRGLYLVQIMRWFLFFPAKQFLFLQSEDYYEDRKVVLQRVFKFLGISAGHWAIADGDDSATKLTLRLLRGTAIRNRQTSTILDNNFFTRQLRRYLADILAPYNEALYTFFARHRILFGSW